MRWERKGKTRRDETRRELVTINLKGVGKQRSRIDSNLERRQNDWEQRQYDWEQRQQPVHKLTSINGATPAASSSLDFNQACWSTLTSNISMMGVIMPLYWSFNLADGGLDKKITRTYSTRPCVFFLKKQVRSKFSTTRFVKKRQFRIRPLFCFWHSAHTTCNLCTDNHNLFINHGSND